MCLKQKKRAREREILFREIFRQRERERERETFVLRDFIYNILFYRVIERERESYFKERESREFPQLEVKT